METLYSIWTYTYICLSTTPMKMLSEILVWILVPLSHGGKLVPHWANDMLLLSIWIRKAK